MTNLLWSFRTAVTAFLDVAQLGPVAMIVKARRDKGHSPICRSSWLHSRALKDSSRRGRRVVRIARCVAAASLSTLAVSTSNSAVASIVGGNGPVFTSPVLTDAYVYLDSTLQGTTDNGSPISNGVVTANALYDGLEGHASVSIKPGSSAGVGGVAMVQWFYEVVGPPGLTQIPLLLSAMGQLSIQNIDKVGYTGPTYGDTYHGDSYAAAQFSGNGVFPDARTVIEDRGGDNAFVIQPVFAGGVGYVFDNVVYTLAVDVGASTDEGYAVDVTFDPPISFADGFDSSGLTLYLSPEPPLAGVPPTSSVPEPSTHWMLLLGVLVWSGVKGMRTPDRARRAAASSGDACADPDGA